MNWQAVQSIVEAIFLVYRYLIILPISELALKIDVIHNLVNITLQVIKKLKYFFLQIAVFVLDSYNMHTSDWSPEEQRQIGY